LAKYRADVDEVRAYPTLGITVSPNDIVELPDDTNAAGLTLIKQTDAKVAPAKDAAAAADSEGV
jgi:hypothetical protein